jgi:hypothetical protein
MVSGLDEEWFTAAADVNAGSYFVFVVYQDPGVASAPVHARIDFSDERFADNDVTYEADLSLEHPCGLGEGVLSGDISAGLCTDVWFVGKLVRDDERHTLLPGAYSDFSLRLLP